MIAICSRAITSIGDAMLTNYERVMKKFIPAFRLKAAQMMINEYGIKQQKVAAILGTTQAAVSKYLKMDSEKYSNIKIDSLALKDFITKANDGSETDAQRIMCSLCQQNKKFDCGFMVK